MGQFAEDALFDNDDIGAAENPQQVAAQPEQVERPAGEADLFTDDVPQPQPDLSTPPQVELTEPPSPEETSVPLGALTSERKKRQSIEAERDQLLQERATLAERARMLQEQRYAQNIQQQRVPEESQDPEPDKYQDPEGHRDWQLRQLQGQNDVLRRGLVEGAQSLNQMRQQMEVSQVQNQSLNLQNQFAQTTPDYYSAVEFLENARSEELGHMGYDATQIARIIENEKGMIVGGCMSRDENGNFVGWTRNPGEAAYAIAVSRGWQGVQQQPQSQPQPQPQPQPQTQPVQQPPQIHQQPQQQAAIPTQMDPSVQRANQLRQGVTQGHSAASATEGSRPIQTADLASMSDAAIVNLMDNDPALMKRLLGG